MLNRLLHRKDLRLVESEARYRAVIENASDMIQSVRPDGTFEFVNDAWKATLGYTDEDLLSTTIFAVIDPDFMDHCMADFMKTLNGETVEFLETHFLTKDGRSLPVEGSITPRFLGDEVVATHGFFRDISERLRARELEERAAELEHEEQARYLEKMAALGKLSAGLAHELNNPAAAMQRANASLIGALQRRDEAMLALAGAGINSEVWNAIEAVANHDSQRQPGSVALSEAEAAIENWLEDRGVDHAWELAPTCAEAGITVADLKVMAEQVPPELLPEAISWIIETLLFSESTEIISQSSQRIADLVIAIKGYSHMDRATEFDANVHDGLENTLVILAHRLRNVEVVREYDQAIPLIRAFGNTLNQVWTNIIDNAIDAINGSGRIIIRTIFDDGCVVVEVEDNGSGIPPEALPRIFEPFYTSKPQGQGTGLGLDTAWRIVTREHEGTITATSEPGRTVFHIRLPVIRQPRHEEPAA